MKKVRKPILIVKIFFLVQSPTSRTLKFHFLHLILSSQAHVAPSTENLSIGPDRSLRRSAQYFIKFKKNIYFYKEILLLFTASTSISHYEL